MTGPNPNPPQITVFGAAGADIAGPTSAGTWATPLQNGAGASGTTTLLGYCKQPATNGLPGNTGGGSPAASGGGTGQSSPTFTLWCHTFQGTPLSLLVLGGTGGQGGSGGTGGTGGTGGAAGSQPLACAK